MWKYVKMLLTYCSIYLFMRWSPPITSWEFNNVMVTLMLHSIDFMASCCALIAAFLLQSSLISYVLKSGTYLTVETIFFIVLNLAFISFCLFQSVWHTIIVFVLSVFYYSIGELDQWS
ncbi:hypothetical protein Q73_08305 [Bacillus coahuilensis m2-6]|uniref:Uncharacterized protein n=1 Tax=Bacillus coahuilensis p1.1.43 TaxID=1150625 RepID=A0A147K8S4_9BACI|nr:hypothetical protein [Bacillus coahuilensis]KUP06602.1 hypothetical protein Q75_08775 [Bacillus coahuilensis p1.1.43]KUP07802.1 hypothetical protein Q73_08305 [Bacillus coahuilensis m2-6]